MTDTWLGKEDDLAWLGTSELSKNGYKIDAVNRERRGGGLAVVYRSNLEVMRQSSDQLSS